MALVRPIAALARPLQPIALRRCVATVSHPPAAALPLAGAGLGSWLRGVVSGLLQRSGVAAAAEAAQASVFDAIFFNKRTFQPSLKRRKRRHGFLRRQSSVHGSEIIGRRRAKGRARTCV